MKLILMGAPAAGKGTIAKLLSATDGSVQISTGDILRAAVDAGNELGRQAQDYMRQGKLVPDEIIMALMQHRLQQPDCRQGFLLDGFPRTIPQAEALRELLGELDLAIDMVVNIEVPREVILERLSTRRTCVNRDCQEIYNTISKPPAVEGICDRCGSAVVQREDETEAAIGQRLETYNAKTVPLIEFYRQQGLLVTVRPTTGEDVVDTITTRLASTGK